MFDVGQRGIWLMRRAMTFFHHVRLSAAHNFKTFLRTAACVDASKNCFFFLQNRGFIIRAYMYGGFHLYARSLAVVRRK